MLGKLHNLARAVADEETERNYVKGEDSYPYPDKKALLICDKDGVLGLGLRSLKQATTSPTAAGENVISPGFDVKDDGKRLFGPLNTKATTYLSQFILHIAAIGDIVDGTDTTHDFNYFSLVYERPKDVRFLVIMVNFFLHLEVLNQGRCLVYMTVSIQKFLLVLLRCPRFKEEQIANLLLTCFFTHQNQKNRKV